MLVLDDMLARNGPLWPVSGCVMSVVCAEAGGVNKKHRCCALHCLM